MTPDQQNQFIQWLDKEIERMQSKQRGFETSYEDILDRGSIFKLNQVREKFLSLIQPNNNEPVSS